MTTSKPQLHARIGLRDVEPIGTHALGANWSALDAKTRAPYFLRSYDGETIDAHGSMIRASIRERIARPPLLHDAATLADLVTWETQGEDLIYAWRLPPGRLLYDPRSEPKPLPADDAVNVVLDVAHAVQLLQKNGLSHGPITPDRIWLCDDGGAVFIPLDDAVRRHELARVQLHRAEQAWHLPPEVEAELTRKLGRDPAHEKAHAVEAAHLRQHASRLEELERSEAAYVYQLACAAFFCLAGVHPYMPINDPAKGLMNARDRVAVPLDAWSGHPVIPVLERGLQDDPRMRHRTIAEFAADFERAFGSASQPHPVASEASPAGPSTRRGTQPLGRSPRRMTQAQREGARANESRDDVEAVVHAIRLWRSFSAVLALAVLALIVSKNRAPTSLVITTDPPGQELEEVIGHAGVSLGSTPIFLPGRTLDAPVLLRLVDPNGLRGPTYSYPPSTFDDIGACRVLNLGIAAASETSAAPGTSASPPSP